MGRPGPHGQSDENRKYVHITVSLPVELYNKLVKVMVVYHLKRSEIIRAALVNYFEHNFGDWIREPVKIGDEQILQWKSIEVR